MMPDDTKEGIDQTANAATSTTDKIAHAAKDATDKLRAGEAIKASGQKVAEGGATIGTKMIDQAEQNAREAFAAMREAAAAKDLADVMRIQGDYLREQSNRSLTQAREIGELIVQFGREAVAPLRPGS